MRRGFTVIEILIVSAVASTLLAVLYSAFSFYARSVSREDRNIERSRRCQEILSLLHDDCAHASGVLAPGDIPAAGLTAIGFTGTAADFLTQPRHGTNLIWAYSGFGSPTPYVVHPFEFVEKDEIADNAAGAAITYSAATSTYGKDGPAEALRLKIPPRSPTDAIVHIAVPPENPTAQYWAIRAVSAKDTEAILWAYHKERFGLMPPGNLIRWSAGLGMVRLTNESLGQFSCRIMHDWSYVDANPPRRTEPFVRLLMTIAAVSLGFDAPGSVPNATAMLVVGH